MIPRKTMAALVGALLLPACSMPSRAPSQHEEYLLRARDADAIKPSTERAMIRVAPVDVAPHVRGIAVVTEGGRVQTMVNQGFAAPIHQLVENAVVDRLRANGHYGVVLAPGHPSAAPLALRLSLRSFEIAVTSSGYEARVVFDGLVERDSDRTIVRAFRASAARPADDSSHGGYVRSLEEALNAAIDVIIQELDAAGIGVVAPALKPDSEPPTVG